MPDMLYLRLFLFSGLVFHKLIWEVMKRGTTTPNSNEKPKKSLINSLIKWIKILFLIFILIQTLFLNFLPISDTPILLRIIGTVIYSIGLCIAVIGRLHLGDNWANLEDYQILSTQKLVDKGIYRFIRHPIYTGDILLLIGLELALNSWFVLGVLLLIPIVVWQALAEEALLVKTFPGYSTYQENTKMFIPFVI